MVGVRRHSVPQPDPRTHHLRLGPEVSQTSFDFVIKMITVKVSRKTGVSGDLNGNMCKILFQIVFKNCRLEITIPLMFYF